MELSTRRETIIVVKPLRFLSPQDAENAFYEALEKADLEAMMAVWAEDEEIVCIHPQGARLTGYDAVRESWRQIFSSGPRLKFQISAQHRFQHLMLAVHVVQENVTVRGEVQRPSAVAATNVYLQTDQGWRMILHHASTAPGTERDEDPPPAVLH